MDEEDNDIFLVWVVAVALTLISFWAQAVITEERFVPWLNVVANRWGLSDDVAGATIVAAGASAPELLASFVSIFVTHSSLGLGTIVGSEIFNQLFVTAGAILAAKDNKLELDPTVVAREVFFYFLSLVLLLFAISDRRPVDDDVENENHLFISRKDGGLLVAGYLFYVTVCAFSDKITSWLQGSKEDALVSQPSYFFEYFPDTDVMVGVIPNIYMFHKHTIVEGKGDKQELPAKPPEICEHKSLIDPPHNASAIYLALHYLCFPFKALIHYTVPDVQTAPTTPKYMILSTVACSIWLIVLSYIMVFYLERIGYLMNIPDSIIGITLSAAGTSLPVYVAAQVAAREGYGNMAVANVFGANTFNILVGLGLPWLIYTLVDGGVYHELRDDEITESVMILLGSLLIFIVLVTISKCVLYRWHALCFVGVYIAYLTYVVSMVYVRGLDNEEVDDELQDR